MSGESTERPIWPANDPWWRHTPKNLGIGYLNLLAAGLIFMSGLYTLMRNPLNTKWTIFEIGLAVLGLVWIFVAANGLKALKYQRAAADRDSSH